MTDNIEDKVDYDKENYFEKCTPIGDCYTILTKIGIGLHNPNSIKDLASELLPETQLASLQRIFDSADGGCELLNRFKARSGREATLGVLENALTNIYRVDLLDMLKDLKKNKHKILVNLNRDDKTKMISDKQFEVSGRRPIWKYLIDWLHEKAEKEFPARQKYYFSFSAGIRKWIDVGQKLKGADTGITLLQKAPQQFQNHNLRVINTGKLRVHLDKNFEILAIDRDPEWPHDCNDEMSSLSINKNQPAGFEDAFPCCCRGRSKSLYPTESCGAASNSNFQLAQKEKPINSLIAIPHSQSDKLTGEIMNDSNSSVCNPRNPVPKLRIKEELNIHVSSLNLDLKKELEDCFSKPDNNIEQNLHDIDKSITNYRDRCASNIYVDLDKPTIPPEPKSSDAKHTQQNQNIKLDEVRNKDPVQSRPTRPLPPIPPQ